VKGQLDDVYGRTSKEDYPWSTSRVVWSKVGIEDYYHANQGEPEKKFRAVWPQRTYVRPLSGFLTRGDRMCRKSSRDCWP
jgi:hypothetical protein